MNLCGFLALWAIERRLDAWDLLEGSSKVVGGIKDIYHWWAEARFDFFFIFEKPLDTLALNYFDKLIGLHCTGLNGASIL